MSGKQWALNILLLGITVCFLANLATDEQYRSRIHGMFASSNRDMAMVDLKARKKIRDAIVLKNQNKTREHRVPDMIIIGVKKCGTGAMMSFLTEHPLIVASELNAEIHYYDRDYDRGLEFYKNKLPPATSDQLVVEKTPSYFTSLPKDLPKIINRDSPNVKIILLLCDPTKRAFSEYARNIEHFQDNAIHTFKDYMKKFFAPLRKKLKNSSEIDEASIEKLMSVKKNQKFMRGIYAYFIPRWLAQFPPSRLLILNGEEFIRAPGIVIERVQRFLNIPILLKQQDFLKSCETGLYCLKRWWTHNYSSSSKPSQEDLDVDVKCAKDSKGRTRSKNPSYIFAKQSEQELREFYKPYNEMLYKILNETYNW